MGSGTPGLSPGRRGALRWSLDPVRQPAGNRDGGSGLGCSRSGREAPHRTHRPPIETVAVSGCPRRPAVRSQRGRTCALQIWHHSVSCETASSGTMEGRTHWDPWSAAQPAQTRTVVRVGVEAHQARPAASGFNSSSAGAASLCSARSEGARESLAGFGAGPTNSRSCLAAEEADRGSAGSAMRGLLRRLLGGKPAELVRHMGELVWMGDLGKVSVSFERVTKNLVESGRDLFVDRGKARGTLGTYR